MVTSILRTYLNGASLAVLNGVRQFHLVNKQTACLLTEYLLKSDCDPSGYIMQTTLYNV